MSRKCNRIAAFALAAVVLAAAVFVLSGVSPAQAATPLAPLAEACDTGDVNGDGSANAGDITCEILIIFSPPGSPPACAASCTALSDRVTALEAKLQHVTASTNDMTVTGANLWVVNGTGTTDGTPNAVGNVIIGYNEERPFGADDRSGSHMLVVGKEHNYSRFGGIVVGQYNTTSGDYASVTGGWTNTASGLCSSVSGGGSNTASAWMASVSGGSDNTASAGTASISGGHENTASLAGASVSGGHKNTASGWYASVSGGSDNTASGLYAASVNGGLDNTASGWYASVNGGRSNSAQAYASSILGGEGNLVHQVCVPPGSTNCPIKADYGSIGGGKNRVLSDPHDWRAGDLYEPD